ncbi:transcription termination factor 5, mitochondrial isoform X2 [Scaptodrosophila lebanonensis]|uniref:Transcription termination factor 5, mitochondrial isoform X2 n=1 Tax=Drosophila lebanonensis TaxID=7225 RepID=A0A6J2TIL3_DROLE|nr:transcription termination factor 5, mitochondrial isoform X2 [Scaptodrosophila lebanonensis]
MLRKSHSQAILLVRSLGDITRGLAATKKPTKKRENVKPPKAPTKESELPVDESLNPGYLTRTLGSNYRVWAAALEKHPELRTVKRKDLQNAFNALKSLNYSVDDIVTKPMIMYYNASTLSNRHSVLLECGLQEISIPTLFKYVTVINRPINILKSYRYIPYDLNVSRKLAASFTDVELPKHLHESVDEIIPLKTLRQTLLNEYLSRRLQMSDEDLAKMWRVYGRVRHKSFQSVQDTIELLTKELNFPDERLRKNIFLLHADADNVRRILQEIPTIDDMDIKQIGFRRPKILMSSCDSLKQTLEHVRAFGIRENAIMRCLEVLTLGPDTVLERLRDLNEIEEFQVLGTNPRILRLVHYQNKARLRLDYLNQLKVRCASLHILSCGSEAFAKFARDGSDRTKGRDIIFYLSNLMFKDQQLLRDLLSRHPNWCHIPLLQVKQCLEYLLSKKFSIDDIFHNIHLLVYPIKRIEEKLFLLQSSDYFEELQLPNVSDVNALSNSQILTLILYLIESEFHFTGDGIWTEQHSHHVENFNNLLPDFPESLNKVYKYGVKPAEKTVMQHV